MKLTLKKGNVKVLTDEEAKSVGGGTGGDSWVCTDPTVCPTQGGCPSQGATECCGMSDGAGGSCICTAGCNISNECTTP